MIYEVTRTGDVRRARSDAPVGGCGADVVLVDRDFQVVDAGAIATGSDYFYVGRDVAELLRTWDVALYARIKRTDPRIFETAVRLLALSSRPAVPVEETLWQMRLAIGMLRTHNKALKSAQR